MRFNRLRSIVSVPLLALSIAVAAPAEDKTPFQAKPADSYPHKQTSEKVTIAGEIYSTDDAAKEAFGKLNPWRHGILPVLVVVQNDSPNAVRMDRAKFVYVLPDRTRIEATPAAELKYLGGVKQPKPVAGPIGIKIGKSSKNPLAAWEIEGRAFSARMIPPGQSASGFVYFQAPVESDASVLYISGLENAATGNELYYFEVPLK